MLYNDIVIDSIIKKAAYTAISEEKAGLQKKAEENPTPPADGGNGGGNGNPPQKPAIDVDSIIAAIKSNPYTTGGAGLGGAAGLALGGDSIQDRILAALLGSGVGGGLGYLADNYDSIFGK